jgi:hypothetical protein
METMNILKTMIGQASHLLHWRTALAVVLSAVLAISATGPAYATLSGGSTFESSDGDLAPNTSAPPAAHDWNSPVTSINCPSTTPGSGTNCGLDLVKNGADNSLGQGSKEDDPNPTVVSGQIPPSKDDLSRFYVNQEKAGGNDYLYLAWERSNLLGSAHMDFEFNQSSSLAGNGVTIQRTAGDLLIDFDFGGSGVPVLALHRWITTGNAATDCEASNTLPCWDKAVTLPAGVVEAAVNSSPVQDTNQPGAPRTLDGNTKNGINSTFGETGINLTAANIFPSNVCVHFGFATLKSRSSGNSFTSELKDFIAPIPVNISNCGLIKIIKVTDPSPDSTNSSFGFTLDDGPLSNQGVPKNFSLQNGQSNETVVFAGNSYSAAETAPAGWDLVSATCDNGSGNLSGTTLSNISVTVDTTTTCTFTNRARGTIIVEKITDDGSGAFGFTSGTLSPSSFTLTTSAAGTGGKDSKTFSNLSPGTYDVAETVPTSWNLVSSSCSDGSNPASIGLSGGETVTCTFHDAREKGAIKITKTRKHAADGSGDHPHAGVTFTITGGELPAGGVTAVTAGNGIACASGLVLSSFVGDYTVTETVPSGYSADNGPQTVSVTTESAGCGSNDSPAAVTFRNTPLTDITVSVNSQVDGGTASTMTCTKVSGSKSGSTGANGDGSLTVQDLPPGTYTCTITIDP